MIERALIIMAKAPRIGQGKQRLAAEIGRVEAWRINRALHAHTLRAAIDPRWRTILCVTPDDATLLNLRDVWPPNSPRTPRLVRRSPQGEGGSGDPGSIFLVAQHAQGQFSTWTPALGALRTPRPGSVESSCVGRISQGPDDLGERLARALKPHRNVAIIGTDCPGLTRAHIAAAFKALRAAPYALGPSEDGGFWILAAREGAVAARAMHNVRWSSPQAAEDLARNLAGPIALLPTLYDIDTAEDLKRHRSALR